MMKRALEKTGSAVYLMALAFVFFVAGAIVILSDTAPAGLLRDAYQAGEALMAQRDMDEGQGRGDFWRVARTEDQGVTVHDLERAFQGYTLYTSGDGPYARLMDMEGRTVFEWRRPYSEIWNVSSPIQEPRPDSFIYIDEARVLPNGDLIAVYIGAGATPWGHGIVKLNRDSELLWSYLDYAHHDFDMDRDGRIYVLTQQPVRERTELFAQLVPPWLNDHLIVLSPDGQEVKDIDLLEAALTSDFAALMYAVPHFGLHDPQHNNTVEVITAEKAATLPFAAREGQILLSMRDIGVVAILDVERETIVWATRGPWIGQHDPSLLDDGNILLFDNLGNMREGNRSRVIEFDPGTMAIEWIYAGDPEHPLDSDIRGAAQRLPNGNTLIEESVAGRLLEVTRDGEIVWEWINPARRIDDNDDASLLPVVPSARRIDPSELSSDFRRLLVPSEESS